VLSLAVGAIAFRWPHQSAHPPSKSAPKGPMWPPSWPPKGGHFARGTPKTDPRLRPRFGPQKRENPGGYGPPGSLVARVRNTRSIRATVCPYGSRSAGQKCRRIQGSIQGLEDLDLGEVRLTFDGPHHEEDVERDAKGPPPVALPFTQAQLIGLTATG